MPRIVIFANGELPNIEKARALVKADDHIICADGGTHHALALGVTPHLVIGDMDSVTKAEVERLKKADVPLELYPRDKNETDLEVALNRALERNPSSILMMGTLGGRLDQTLGNISLLSDSRLAILDVRLDDGVEEVFFCRRQIKVDGRRGRYCFIDSLAWRGQGNPYGWTALAAEERNSLSRKDTRHQQ